MWLICNCTLTVLIHRALWRTHATVQRSHAHPLHLAIVHIVSHPLLMHSLHWLNRGKRLVIHTDGILGWQHQKDCLNLQRVLLHLHVLAFSMFLHLLDNYWSTLILSNVKSNPLPYASGACPVDTLQPLGPAWHVGRLGALGWGPSCCVRSQERGRDQGWALGWAPETGQHLVRDQHGTSQPVAHWGSTSISWEYGWKRRKAWTNCKWRILTIVQNTKHCLASQITAFYIY